MTGTCLRGPLVTGDNMSLIYTFTFRGTDIVGHVGTGVATSMVIDNKKPISSANTGSTLQNTGAMSIPFVASDDYSDIKYVQVFYRHNGGGWASIAATPSSPLTFNADSLN